MSDSVVISLPVQWGDMDAFGHVGETSLAIDDEIRDDIAAEEIYARGSSVVVMIDYRTGEKVRVPDDVRAAVDALRARAAR